MMIPKGDLAMTSFLRGLDPFWMAELPPGVSWSVHQCPSAGIS